MRGDLLGNTNIVGQLVVVKFGGSVLASESDYVRASVYVRELLERGFRPVVVVSAAKNTTQDILDAYSEMSASKIEEVKARHESIVRGLGGEGSNLKEALRLLEGLERTFNAYRLLSLDNGSVKDLLVSFGERVSIHLMAEALEQAGVSAVALYGRRAGIVTNERFGEATPVKECCELVKRALLGHIETGVVPVVAGFIGESISGRITTMGRGGSDFTATYIARCIQAKEVQLITNVPGIFTGDPTLFPNAKVIPTLSYDEAIELSHLGGKRFHPRTFEPLVDTSIVTRVRSLDDRIRETVIKSDEEPPPLKATVVTGSLELVTVQGTSMVGRLGTAARIMSLFSSAGVNIRAIGQTVSETSINLVVERGMSKRVLESLRELASSHYIRDFKIVEDVASAIIIGYGLRDPRMLGSLLALLKDKHVLMLVKGPLDLSITTIADSETAVAVAREFHNAVLEQIER
uniref:Aspartokinase n=1 Tax=Fervidicoccus fontis TaxID=683846 RepID=A0A7J3ZJN7_9CREN